MRVRYSFSSRRTGIIEGRNDHKRSFTDVVKEVIDISDILLEVIDIRYIENTRSFELEEIIKKKKKVLIYVLNKADLIDISEFQRNVDISPLDQKIIFSCKSRIGKDRLIGLIKNNIKKLGINRAVSVGIVGYPNTGKSSVINYLVSKKSARTSDQAGFTKGIQSIRLNKNIFILDTPGIIPLKEKSMFSASKKHIQTGIIKYNQVKDPSFVVFSLMKENPGLFEKYYKVDAKGDSEILIEEYGRRKNLLEKGNKIDKDRTSRFILKDWQEGKIK